MSTVPSNSDDSVIQHHEKLWEDIEKMHGILQAQKPNLTPAYELDHLLKTRPELLSEFEMDPKRFAKERVGLELPEELQLHFLDAEGIYHPQTGDPTTETAPEEKGQQHWGRTEIRISVPGPNGGGTIAIGMGDAPFGIPQLPGTNNPPFGIPQLPGTNH